MSQISFTSSRMSMAGKDGVLRCDSSGYYTVVLGALNVYNSAGEYYIADREALNLFEKSSLFMRRISDGVLKGENGHPKFPVGGKMRDYIERLMTIEETNVISHYRKVWLDPDFGKKNPRFNNSSMVGIMAEVCPSGEKGAALKRSLENPSENVCFSIRAFTKDYQVRGVTQRVLDTIVTWDVVTEPGIAAANKWDSPSLEALKIKEDYSRHIDVKDLKTLLESSSGKIATESTKLMLSDLVHRHEVKSKNTTPIISNW
jgi:hypothetical protein